MPSPERRAPMASMTGGGAGAATLWGVSPEGDPPSALPAAQVPTFDAEEPQGAMRLSVLCTGLEFIDGHYEYIFRVFHPGGCSWRVQKRYSDLFALDEQMSQGLEGMPPFPPKHTLGDRLLSSEKEVATRRVVQLQRYLALLTARHDAAHLPELLTALGEAPPEPVASVTIVRWEQWGAEKAAVELQVSSVPQGDDDCRPVERHEATVRAARRAAPSPRGRAEPGGGIEVDGATFGAPAGEPLRVVGLRQGTQAELSIRAWNAVGASPPVLVRLAVPAPPGPVAGVPGEPERSGGTPSRAGETSTSLTASASASAADPPAAAPPPFQPRLDTGSRVTAVYAGDGGWYDAVVRHAARAPPGDGLVTVDWLRPAPLAREDLRCVCEAGLDDTRHRRVPAQQIRPAGRSGEGL